MSTVSTWAEWRPVAWALSDKFAVTLVDWPGFGESSRPRADYSPALFREFLRALIQARFAGALGLHEESANAIIGPLRFFLASPA